MYKYEDMYAIIYATRYMPYVYFIIEVAVYCKVYISKGHT